MREIVDYTGVKWLAWDTRPEASHPVTRFESYLQGFLDGWLVFESEDGRQRRRLHPIPRGWAELPDAQLRQLLEQADVTGEPAAGRSPGKGRSPAEPRAPAAPPSQGGARAAAEPPSPGEARPQAEPPSPSEARPAAEPPSPGDARPTGWARSPAGERRSPAPESPPEGKGLRSFLYPGGRLWTVAEVPVQYRDPEGEPLGEPRTVLRFAAGRRTLDLLAWPQDWAAYDEQQLADLLYRAFPRRTAEPVPGMPARRRGDRETRDA